MIYVYVYSTISKHDYRCDKWYSEASSIFLPFTRDIYERKKQRGAERGKESARVRIRSARVVKDGVVTREGRGDFLVYTRLHLITISFLIYLISKILGAQGFSAE